MGNTFVKSFIKKISNIHTPGSKKSIMVFSTPRSGSTWLMELIWSQPGFKYCNEPDNLRNPVVRKKLALAEWNQLYEHAYSDKILAYYKGINNGSIGELNPNPFDTFYRFKTNRIVFKILHSMEDRVMWLSRNCDSIPLLLIRHPIAVSVSREVLPRTECYFLEDFSANIPQSIMQKARHIVDHGSFLEKGAVCWCFENYYQLKEVKEKKYLGVTYEEMVVNPSNAISTLVPYLDLGDKEIILKNMSKPSKTTAKSDSNTQEIMAGTYSPELILNKWRKKVSKEDINNVQYILDFFEIDLYKADEAMPVKPLAK